MPSQRTKPDEAGPVQAAGQESADIAAERPTDQPASDPFARMDEEHAAHRRKNAEAEAEALRANGETNRRVEEYARRATEESEIRAGLLE